MNLLRFVTFFLFLADLGIAACPDTYPYVVSRLVDGVRYTLAVDREAYQPGDVMAVQYSVLNLERDSIAFQFTSSRNGDVALVSQDTVVYIESRVAGALDGTTYQIVRRDELWSVQFAIRLPKVPWSDLRLAGAIGSFHAADLSRLELTPLADISSYPFSNIFWFENAQCGAVMERTGAFLTSSMVSEASWVQLDPDETVLSMPIPLQNATLIERASWGRAKRGSKPIEHK